MQRGREGKTDWWRYPIGVIIVIVCYVIGSLPFQFYAVASAMAHGSSIAELEKNNNLIFDPSFTHIDKNLGLFLELLIFVVAMIGLWVVVRFLHQKRFLSIINHEGRRFDFKRFFFATGMYLLLSAGLLAFSYFSAPETFKLILEPKPFIIGAILCLFLLPIQTGWEELLFRGYIFQGMGLWMKKPWLPWLITSLLFGLLHMANAEVSTHGIAEMLPQYVFMGMALGFVAVLDERLELAMGMHFANNFFSILAVTSPDMSVQSNAIWSVPSIGGFSDFLISTVPMFLLIALFWRVYKWNIGKLTRSY